MHFLFFYLVCLTLSTAAPKKSSRLTPLPFDLLSKFKQDIKYRIDNFDRSDRDENILSHSLIATLVRLVFHDCGGINGCNGCINPNNPIHNGIEYGAILPIEQVYKNEKILELPTHANSKIDFMYTTNDNWKSNPSGIAWMDEISRTDMWILSATYALEYGVKISNIITSDIEYPLSTTIDLYENVCIINGVGIHKKNITDKINTKCIDIPYMIGRTDCKQSPWVDDNKDQFIADPNFNFNQGKNYFLNTFGYNTNEMLTIMGAHTLGRGHPSRLRNETNDNINCCSGSGYRGNRKPGDEGAFNHGYYWFLKYDAWIQQNANDIRTLNISHDEYFDLYKSIKQWTAVTQPVFGEKLIGLNMIFDMTMLLDYNTDINNVANCIHPVTYQQLNDVNIRQVYKLYDGIRIPKCNRNSETKELFDIYVNDNTRFLYDFMIVWEKMINTFGGESRLSCDKNECILKPDIGYDIICDPQYTECNVICDTPKQCNKGVIIEANSKIVNIRCTAEHSCDFMKIYGNNTNTINILLSSKNSGEEMIIEIENELAIVNIIANGVESFKGGMIYCDSFCNLQCNGIDSCEDTIFECLASKNQCQCIGIECDTNMIQHFGESNCNHNESYCVVEPDGIHRIVALNNVNTLIIDCTVNEQQCKRRSNDFSIYSAAKTTIIKCNSINACADMELYVGDLPINLIPKGFKYDELKVKLNKALNEEQTLLIDCNYESACEEMRLYTAGDISTTILGNGEEALEDIIIKCDNCKSLNFECRDFDGCIGAQIFCPELLSINEINRCVCQSIYVNLTTHQMLNTEAPRNSCPEINIFDHTMRTINNININIKHENNQINKKIGIKLMIIASLVGFVLLSLMVFIMWKCKQKYQKHILSLSETIINQNDGYGTWNNQVR